MVCVRLPSSTTTCGHKASMSAFFSKSCPGRSTRKISASSTRPDVDRLPRGARNQQAALGVELEIAEFVVGGGLRRLHAESLRSFEND